MNAVITETGFYYIDKQGKLKYGMMQTERSPLVDGFKGTRNYILNIFNYGRKNRV